MLSQSISGGIFANSMPSIMPDSWPSGPYNANAKVNIGYGHWTGVFGVGRIVYADAERTWGFSIYSHYLIYGSQMDRNYSIGDQVPFEWCASKTFKLGNGILGQATIGA
jgi:hypothetical protein